MSAPHKTLRIRVAVTLVLGFMVFASRLDAFQVILPPAIPPESQSVPSYPPNTFANVSNSRIFASGPARTFDASPLAPVVAPPNPASLPPQVVYNQPLQQYIYEPQFQPQTNYARHPNTPGNWFSVDALLWWTSGVDVPVIASTSPLATPGLQAGVLGQPDTSVLFGGGELFDFLQSGFRVRGGHWFDRNDGSGWQAEFFMLATRSDNFNASSTGDPILGRPFTNALSGDQDAQLIAYPGLASGSLNFNAETRLYSIGFNYWAELVVDTCDCCCCSCNSCGQCGQRRNSSNSNGCGEQYYAARDRSLGLKLGPRFYHLDDTLLADESLTSIASGNQFRILDSFKTENSFLGAEIGLQMRRRRQALSLDLGLNLALGATRQELDVRGQTTVTTGGVPVTTNGGFYAQSTNSGSWHRNRFSLVPSLKCALGYEVRNGWRLSVAYNLMYWTNVLRAAEQIDSTINPNLFPPSIATATDPNRPAVLFKESDYLAHGISFGIEKRW